MMVPPPPNNPRGPLAAGVVAGLGAGGGAGALEAFAARMVENAAAAGEQQG